MKKLTLSGGFHNATEITVQVSDNDYKAFKSGNVALGEILTPCTRETVKTAFLRDSRLHLRGIHKSDHHGVSTYDNITD